MEKIIIILTIHGILACLFGIFIGYLMGKIK